MIQWLVQSVDAHPALARGLAPTALLNPREQAEFAALKTAKRRRDWLLGRWTAKHLLQVMVAQREGRRPPLHTIAIANLSNGAPIVSCRARQTTDNFSLSISHSHEHAFCAAVSREAWPLGVDMERIGPRAGSFVLDYFTEDEIALADRAPDSAPEGGRDLIVTAVWSAKEAALKALRLGLTVDTRAVTCLIQPVMTPPQAWFPFEIRCDRKRLQRPVPRLTGWWQAIDDFVLCMVTGASITLGD